MEGHLKQLTTQINSNRGLTALVVAGTSVLICEYCAEMKWITRGPSYYLEAFLKMSNKFFLALGTKFNIIKLGELCIKHAEILFKSLYKLVGISAHILISPLSMFPESLKYEFGYLALCFFIGVCFKRIHYIFAPTKSIPIL